MHTVGSVLLLMDGMLCCYAASRAGLRIIKEPAYSVRISALSDCLASAWYLTDGRTRRLKIGNLQILLRRTTPRNMATAGTISGLVIQALRWLGRHRDYEPIVRQLGKRLSANDKEVHQKVGGGWSKLLIS